MIRRMNNNDVYSIERLETKVLNNSLGVSFLDQEINLNPFAYYIVYELNGNIVGYLGTRIYDDSCEVLNFLVDNNFQGQGIGQSLFNYLLEELNKRLVKTINLEVRKSNKKAINFYYKNGFVKANIRKKYYDNNEDAYILIKEV